MRGKKTIKPLCFNTQTNDEIKADGVYSLLHEVVHFRVDSLDDGHQVVQDVFSVVHSGVHEVPVMKVRWMKNIR